MKALSITNLKKEYTGGLQALKGIDLNVEKGDFFALLGPNGAGKSTTIGIISSLVTKTSGEVKILDIDIDENHSLAKKKLGVVGQEVNFNQFEKVGDIIRNQAGYYGLSFKQARDNAKYYMRKLDIWDKRNEQARKLSGGMKRRVMVAKALVNNPDLLILDEPTAGVDIELRRSLWDFLTEINDQGTTIILTTHYLEEAEKMCDRIGILSDGNLVALDTTRNLLQRIQTKVVYFTTDKKINIKDKFFETLKIISNEENKLVLSYEKSRINIDKIITEIKKQDVIIQDISTDDGDLEDVFLRLTKN